MTFIASMLLLAAAAGVLGAVIGLAYGIETERKRLKLSPISKPTPHPDAPSARAGLH